MKAPTEGAVREPTESSGQNRSAAGKTDARDPGLRVRGRNFLLAFYKTLRSITLYPIENSQVTESLDELTEATSEILNVDGELEVRISRELFYVNDVRLRLELENFASFSQVFRICSQAGIGVIRIDAPPGQR